MKNLRAWIEIDSVAAKRNYEIFRKIIGPGVKLWSVVKSNAYGHGLVVFSLLMDKFGVDGFCVDSFVEGLHLRKAGIKKPILALGPTLPELFGEATKNNITITISNPNTLAALRSFVAKKATKEKNAGRFMAPEFHIKIDTGMHRQGFYPDDLQCVAGIISNSQSLISKLSGVYTHFASAKDINYPTYTDEQFRKFRKAVKLFESAGFPSGRESAPARLTSQREAGRPIGKHPIVAHCSATGGTLANKKYHLDAVRVGIGLYGLWPSKELQIQLPKIKLKPVLSWRAVVSEVKKLKAGDYVGYDLTERVPGNMKIAVIPVGYWHGFPRSLSGTGEVLINGRRSKVLGRVSMDLVVAGPVGAKCGPGDIVTFIGRSGSEEIQAADVAQKSGTIHYELLTRLNPLMERILL